MGNAIDAALDRRLAAAPQLAVDFNRTFGSQDALIAQEWINYGLAQHADEMSDVVLTAREAASVPQPDQMVTTPVNSGRTVADLEPRTRVVLINHNDSFYGAVGTVDRPVSGTHVRVAFDLKPNAHYDVPAAHLDLHRDMDHVRSLLEMDDGRWTFTGVPSLVQFLRAKEANNGKWAFTGSVALSYWAREYNVRFRHPHDMDIVVANLDAWYFDFGLAVNGSPGMPSLTADHRTVQLSIGKLDIIADGRGLGEFGAGPHLVGGVPVVGLRTIGYYKKKRGAPKDLEDLKVVNRLLRLQNR
ncbi:hypothetical protein AB0M48_30000 [Lentzea sp. NPDC051208]|uniref:hypothetical protein n=1 Tax=Lentzea sp. NPDC051208 TaxID=3154642 RepID=UPI00342A043E